MTVVTIIEWVPALRPNDLNWIYLMLFPLLICNTYQLLILYSLIENSFKRKKIQKAEKLGPKLRPFAFFNLFPLYLY